MSREKKFRFLLQYNKPTDSYYKNGEVEIFWMDLVSDSNGLARFPIDEHWTILRCDDFIGKQDKNGEDLYEEDRVKFKTLEEFDSIGDQEFTGTLRWDDEDASFFIDNDDEGYPHVKLWFAKDIEKVEE